VVVTTTDDDGGSGYIELIAQSFAEHDQNGAPLYAGTRLWGTPDGTARVGAGQNADEVKDPWFPGPGGTRFLVFSFMPKSQGGSVVPRSADGDDARETEMTDFASTMDPDRPGMHMSDTVDFVYVLSGEMYLELDRGEVLVRQGDAVVGRGGWHNWRVETEDPCIIVSLMLGADRVPSKSGPAGH
jgi:mannose-6-phosphate isomerase-like protein (cupin superfamily)